MISIPGPFFSYKLCSVRFLRQAQDERGCDFSVFSSVRVELVEIYERFSLHMRSNVVFMPPPLAHVMRTRTY